LDYQYWLSLQKDDPMGAADIVLGAPASSAETRMHFPLHYMTVFVPNKSQQWELTMQSGMAYNFR
jgi:hypothetical protein